jgi:hypothetical protein
MDRREGQKRGGGGGVREKREKRRRERGDESIIRRNKREKEASWAARSLVRGQLTITANPALLRPLMGAIMSSPPATFD